MEAVGDPTRWPHLLGEFELAMGARGVGLLPERPRPDFWWSASMGEGFAAYVAEGWHRDGRDPYRRAIPRHQRGLISTDKDIFAPGELASTPYYNEYSKRWDFLTWLGAPVRIEGELHSLSLHRGLRQPGFDHADIALAGRFALRLGEVANLCARIARRHLTGITDAFQLIGQPALALSVTGRILAVNEDAERLMGPDIRLVDGGLRLEDRNAAIQLEAMILKARWTPEGRALGVPPVLVRRAGAPPILIKALPVDGPARCRFLGARLLLLMREVKPARPPTEEALRVAFGLTAAEARLAVCLAAGDTIDDAAGKLAISRETARSQSKAVYAKTGVARQASLVALLQSLSLARNA